MSSNSKKKQHRRKRRCDKPTLTVDAAMAINNGSNIRSYHAFSRYCCEHYDYVDSCISDRYYANLYRSSNTDTDNGKKIEWAEPTPSTSQQLSTVEWSEMVKTSQEFGSRLIAILEQQRRQLELQERVNDRKDQLTQHRRKAHKRAEEARRTLPPPKNGTSREWIRYHLSIALRERVDEATSIRITEDLRSAIRELQFCMIDGRLLSAVSSEEYKLLNQHQKSMIKGSILEEIYIVERKQLIAMLHGGGGDMDFETREHIKDLIVTVEIQLLSAAAVFDRGPDAHAIISEGLN